MENFIRESVMDKAYSSISLSKIDLNVTKQKLTCLLGLGFAIDCEIKLIKSKEKVTYNQLVRLKKEIADFLANVYSFDWENLLLSSFPKCLRCLSPVFVAEFPDASETVFENVLSKLINFKTIASTVVKKAKSEYYKSIKDSQLEKVWLCEFL